MSDRLRARRLQLWLSLRELAELSGVSKAMIVKVQDGHVGPDRPGARPAVRQARLPWLGLRSTASPAPSPGPG
jgi:transcriptional regulator with XRE-family HTH domain